DLAGGCEDDRRVEALRREVERVTHPRRAQLGRQRLVAIAIARAHVHLGAAETGELNGEVTGGAEAVEAEPRAAPPIDAFVQAGQAERSIADDARTEERGNLLVIERLGKRVHEALRGG